MNVQIFVLINREINVISGLIALSRVSACVVDHDSHKFDFCLSGRQLVVFDDLVGKVRDVYSSVALPCDEEIVFLKVREFVEKSNQSLIVVLCSCSVIIFRTSF